MSSVGGSNPPYAAIRLRVCEKMHWTFEEFDNTSGGSIFEALEVWRLEANKVI